MYILHCSAVQPVRNSCSWTKKVYNTIRLAVGAVHPSPLYRVSYRRFIVKSKNKKIRM